MVEVTVTPKPNQCLLVKVTAPAKGLSFNPKGMPDVEHPFQRLIWSEIRDWSLQDCAPDYVRQVLDGDCVTLDGDKAIFSNYVADNPVTRSIVEAIRTNCNGFNTGATTEDCYLAVLIRVLSILWD